MTENPSADNAVDARSDEDVSETRVVGTSTSTKKDWLYLPKRIGYRIFRLSGELTAIILGLAIFWFFALNVVLSREAVDVSRLSPNAEMWFSEAFNGSDAKIGDMKLTWLPASNTIVFEAKNVVITDKKGVEIETIPRLQTETPLAAAMKGALTPERLLVDGGVVTWLRTSDGKVIAGLGTPNTVGRFGPVWRSGQKNVQANRPDISGIKTVTVTNAEAHVVDDSDGVDIIFKETDIVFASTVEGITLKMTSNLRKDTAKIPLKFSMKASPNVKSYAIDVTAAGLNPSVISPKRGRFAGLNTLNTFIDLEASVYVDEVNGLETANVDLRAGKGRVKIGKTLAPFDEVRLKAKLTADSQVMDISDFALKSSKVSFTGDGTLKELGALTDGNNNSSPLFDLKLANVNINQTPQFAAPIILRRLDASGRLDADSRQLNLASLKADFGTHQFSMSGRAKQTDDGVWDSIALKGQSSGTLSPKDLLAIWPVAFADGARRWLDRSILRASIRNIEFEANFPKEVLNNSRLPANEDLELTFDVTEGDVRYISTMTPYTNTSGQGLVRGNSAMFEATGGQIGNVNIINAKADIPRLQPKGGDLIVDVVGEGRSSDLFGLIDQKPFEFASKYGVNPQDFGGSGKIDVRITRPLLEFFDADRIKYEVNGIFDNVSAPFSLGPHKLKNGFVTMTADSEGMTVKGPVSIGPWNADLNWQETFDYGATPTLYKVEGRIDRDTLDALGIGFREYFDGEVFIKVDATGTGLDLQSAKIDADLINSSLQLRDYWSKGKGTPGQITGQLIRRPNGAIVFEGMEISAPGLDVQGRLELAQDLRLLDLSLTRASIKGFVDAAIESKPDKDGELLSVIMSGRYLDVSPFVTSAFESSGQAIDIPIRLTAGLDTLALHEAYVLQNANLLFAHNGEGITNAQLGGRTADGEFKIDMLSSEESSVRNVTIDIPNASEAAYAFLGLDNISGGRLQIDAQLPPVGVKGALNGVADVEDFKLVKAPILAQMLSIASLTGIFDTLGGEGLNFNEFIVPFSLEEGALSIRNARVSGPALGMTGHGEIQFSERKLDLDGALVPAYTANSLLGDIPVIGDIFVGKKGEGIFALSYTVKGSFDKTQIAVNPLSALTPGFLRGIFRTKRDKLPENIIAEIESVKPETNQ